MYIQPNWENVQSKERKKEYVEKSMKQLLKEEQSLLVAEINEKIMMKKDLMIPDYDSEFLK